MKIKRLLAFSLRMVMLVSALPGMVFADETDPETAETAIVETSEPEETEEKDTSESSKESGEETGPEETSDAVEAKDANTWGKLKWSFNSSTGVLSITGKGNMPAITSSKGAPWYDERNHIKKIVIGKGITSISDYAFYFCDAVSVSIPSGVKSIGKNAF